MSATDRRVALVSGANRGIGRAVATGLAAHGFVVAVGARSLASAQAVAAEIGLDAFVVQLDVTDGASSSAAVQAVIDRAGRIDVLVNNAGGHYDSGTRASEVSDADIADAIEVNLVGPWRLSRAVIPHMRSRGYGRIVNVTSRSGTFADTWADAPAYGVSKAACNMFTLQLAKELDGSGILVNACCPGWVRTDMGGPDAEKSPEEGADTPIWLAMLPDGGPTGANFGERERISW